MSCEDIPSLLDLQNVKKNSDDFGRLMGTDEGYSTNGVTGQVRPTYNKVMKNLGFKPGSGDFTTGFTVMPGYRDLVWYDPVSHNWYSYLGAIPSPSGHQVAPGTNPVGSADWMLQYNYNFQQTGAGTVNRNLQDKMREVVSVKDFKCADGLPVQGDGVHDDTTGVQAAINHALQTSCCLHFEANTYRITAPLVIGSTVDKGDGSPSIEGVRSSVIDNRGTTILLEGTGHTCIVEFRAGAARNLAFKGIKLRCATAPASNVYAATHGIFFSQQIFSGIHFEDVSVFGARNAIYIQSGGYHNGEFNTYETVKANQVQKFFVMAPGTGQAYGHMFHGCGMLSFATGVNAQGSSEYVFFELGDSNGGYGIYVQDFNATIVGTTVATTHRATYFKNNGATGPCYFKGGRVEGLTTLIENNSAASSSIVEFSNVDCAALYSTSSNPLVTSTTISRGIVNVSGCMLPQVDGAVFAVSLNPADKFRYAFERCMITKYNGSSSFTFDVEPSRGQMAAVEFNQCYVRRGASSEVELFHKSFRGTRETSLGLLTSDDNSVIQGVPSNRLLYPYFNGATPSSPWVASTPFAVYQNGGSNVTGFTGSPYGVYLRMNAGMTVYQDVFTVTAINQRIHYLAAVMAGVENSNNKLVITLSNTTTGEVYDRIKIGQSTGNAPFIAPLVRLDALTTSASGTIRLTWEAPATNIGFISIYLDWQTVSSNPQCAFVNTTTAEVAYSHPWGNVNNLRAFGRLSIPNVPRTAADLESLPNVESDLAISSTTKRMIYYANSHGNELPNQDVGSAAPTNGTWPQGWIRWNSAPAAGGTIGWVCIAAGTPGTWKTFGAIAA